MFRDAANSKLASPRLIVSIFVSKSEVVVAGNILNFIYMKYLRVSVCLLNTQAQVLGTVDWGTVEQLLNFIELAERYARGNIIYWIPPSTLY